MTGTGRLKDYGPDHWEQLYLEGRIPWDAGRAPQDLDRYLTAHAAPGRALVPGCGSGYEAVGLARAGYQVVAIDFSPAAVRRARDITHGSGVTVSLADFFDLDDDAFDLIYERAFMCAMPPAMRTSWARRCADLLNPGGRLAGLFFIDADATDGPPFGIGRRELAELLDCDFRCLEDVATEGSLPVFAARERWQVWERRRQSVG